MCCWLRLWNSALLIEVCCCETPLHHDRGARQEALHKPSVAPSEGGRVFWPYLTVEGQEGSLAIRMAQSAAHMEAVRYDSWVNRRLSQVRVP